MTTAPHRRTDDRRPDYGDRLRLGIVVPSGNRVAEPEIGAMFPEGVAPFFTRLKLTGSSAADLAAMVEDLDDATDLLADVDPGLLMFHCTAVTTADPVTGRDLARRMARRSGVPASTTAEAIVDGLRALGARRIALLTPYTREVHDREAAFLVHHGFEVVSGAAMGIDTNAEMGRVEPHQLYEFALSHQVSDADAYLYSCTAIRTAGVIDELEEELGRPVVTSNQAMVWQALRLAGLQDRRTGFGRLLQV